jgi:hypothetical protein
MTDEHQQAQALLGIVDPSPSPLVPDALVPDAWTIALALQDRKRRCRAIAALIPRLPDELLDAAIQAVAERAQEPGALAAAAALVDRLPEGRLTYLSWSAMPTMTYDKKMVVTMLVALKYGDPQAVDWALEYLVEEVDTEFKRCQYLAVLIPRLPATAFDRVMAVLAACRARYRSDTLLALARHAPVDKITALLKLAAGDVAWEDTPPDCEPQPWQRMMQEVGPRLAGPEQEAGALAVAQALLVERGAEAIEVLAPHLRAESARNALRDIEARLVHWENFRDTRWLMIAVAALARRLPPAEAGLVIERYVKKYCSVDHDLHVVPPPREEEPSIFEAEHLAPAASFLPRDTVRLTLRSICRGISVGGNFAADLTPALARMAPTVGTNPDLVREAFAMMLNPAAWQPASRLTVLSVLAPHLDDDSLDEAMRRVLPGPVEVECFAAIAALGRELAEDQRAAVARRALDAALDVGHDRQRTLTVAALAPTMPANVAKAALEFVGSVTRLVHPPHVFSALDSLAPRLPVTALAGALEIFLDTRMVGSGDIQHVTRLFERLGRDDPGAIRNHFQGPQRSGSWAWDSWLWALAPFLPAALAEEALAVAMALPDDYDRRVSLAALAPRLPDRLRTAAAHEALRLLDVAPDNMTIRIAVLARLAAAATTDEVTAACQQLLADLRPADLLGTDHSWDAFRDLLTHLPSDVVEDVLRFSTRLFLDERCQLIRTLAPRLPDRLLPDLVAALEAAAAVSDAELGEHGRALVALAARTPDEDERHRILTAVLQRMVKRRWWHATGPTFVDLIPLSPPPLRSQAVAAAVQQCFDEHRPDDLGPLLDVLEEAELQLIFEQLGRIGDPHLRAATTAAVLRRAGALADRSMGLLDVDVFRAWPPAGTRAELFTLVGASAWWIRRHGGDRAVAAAIDAVFDVSRWWR